MASGVGTRGKPKPGDVFVCADCGQMALWLGATGLRRPTYEEAQQALEIAEVAAVLTAWQLAYRATRGHRRH